MATKTEDAARPHSLGDAVRSILILLAVAALAAIWWLDKKSLNGFGIMFVVLILMAVAAIAAVVYLVISLFSGAAELAYFAQYSNAFAAMR